MNSNMQDLIKKLEEERARAEKAINPPWLQAAKRAGDEQNRMREQVEITIPPHISNLSAAIERNKQLYEAIKRAYDKQQKARQLATGLISGGTLGSLIVGIAYPPALIPLAAFAAISYVGVTLYESSKESYISKKSGGLLDE